MIFDIIKWKKPVTKHHIMYDNISIQSWVGKSTDRKQSRDSRGQGERRVHGGKWGVGNNGFWVSFSDNKNVLKLDYSDGSTTLWIY